MPYVDQSNDKNVKDGRGSKCCIVTSRAVHELHARLERTEAENLSQDVLTAVQSKEALATAGARFVTVEKATGKGNQSLDSKSLRLTALGVLPTQNETGELCPLDELRRTRGSIERAVHSQ